MCMYERWRVRGNCEEMEMRMEEGRRTVAYRGQEGGDRIMLLRWDKGWSIKRCEFKCIVREELSRG